MLVLHAAGLDDTLALWGEVPGGPSGAPTPVSDDDVTPHHPHAASFAELAAALKPRGGAREGEAVVWVPAGAVPVPSTPLLGDSALPHAPTIRPFRVPVALLDAATLARLLLASVDRRVVVPGVVVGADLAAWAQLARLAASLVVRQRYVPGLRREGSRAHATWDPVPAPEDSRALLALAMGLPPSATAMTTVGRVQRPTPRAAVAAVVATLVDGLVRDAQPEARAPEPEGVHDAWIRALSARSGELLASEEQHRALAEGIERWRQPLALDEAAPYRLALRLEEPGRDDVLWTLRPLVHPKDDPSLLVSAEDLFTRSAVRNAMARPDADVRAFALAALARAAATAPLLAGALRRTPPAPVALETDEAHTFLTETALLLEAAGFAVLLPSWFTRAGERPRLTVRAKAEAPLLSAGAGLHMGAVVHVDWQVALGDDPLTREELESLAALKAPLVRLRGQWVVVDAGAIHSALDRWRRRSEAVTVRDLVQARIGATQLHGLPVSSVEAEGPLGALLCRLEGRGDLEEVPVPKALFATLRPYQRRGLSWMAFLTGLGFGGCLADDMGLGKTVQTLALLAHLRERGERRPLLLVCPTSLLCNWQKEAARFVPDVPVLVHHGAERARGAAFVDAARGAGLVLVSYGLLLRDLSDLQRVGFAGMVLDEAQNVKNPASRQARAARAVPVDWRIALTGTPVENHVGDLWAILDLCNPGLLGSAAAFHRAFFVPIQGGDRDAARQLQRLTGPFVLRRVKTDPRVAPDLPDRIVATVSCTLTREQATLYAAVLQETDAKLKDAEGMERKGLVLATITRLKQVCNHPAQLLGDESGVAGRSGKLERLAAIVDEVVDGGEAVLVFTQFTEMGRIIVRHLGESLGLEAPFLHGGVPRAQRDAMVERFQREDGPPVLVLSLKAGGTGLNLTRANHVVHYDRWWNPAVENQASDRAWRIGQRRTVEVHTLVCAGTFEERIDALLARKRRVASRVVASGEAALTELSNDELRRVLALSATALDEAGDG